MKKCWTFVLFFGNISNIIYLKGSDKLKSYLRVWSNVTEHLTSSEVISDVGYKFSVHL